MHIGHGCPFLHQTRGRGLTIMRRAFILQSLIGGEWHDVHACNLYVDACTCMAKMQAIFPDARYRVVSGTA